MPSLKKVLARQEAVKAEVAATVAHIVYPASQLAAAKRGEAVTSRCGATITADPKTDDAPVCRACFIAQLETDDSNFEERERKGNAAEIERARTAREQAARDRESARQRGIEVGREAHAAELRTLAAAQTQQARVLAAAPRYEDLGQALRLKPVEGGEATVRKSKVGSVQLQKDGQQHAVTVDDCVVHVGEDEEVARRHYQELHAAVFGNGEAAAS